MTNPTRRNHGSAFMGKVALETIKGEQTVRELAARFQVDLNQIAEWKKQLLKRASEVYDRGQKYWEPDTSGLHSKIGKLTIEIDFLSGALGRIIGSSAMRKPLCRRTTYPN